MTKIAPPIPHLRDRPAALEPLGWTGRDAEWIALVCLHAGVFVRSQFCSRYGLGRPAAHHFARRLTEARIVREHSIPERQSPQRYCHFHTRGLYRALGVEHIRHRKRCSTNVLFRRLLSLDYVIERPDLPWLPTEAEKVAHFESLGIERGVLPRLLKGRRGHRTRRYFGRIKLPLAAQGRDAVFVYVDPDRDTDKELRTWAREHEPLWNALRALGGSVRVVAVVRTLGKQQHYAKVLKGWVGSRQSHSAAGPLTPEEREELTALHKALDTTDHAALDRWGGLMPAARKYAPLKRRAKLPDSKSSRIDSYSTHLAERLSENVFAA